MSYMTLNKSLHFLRSNSLDELHKIFRFADGSTIRLNGTKHFENGNCFLLQRLRYCYNRFHQRHTAKQP